MLQFATRIDRQRFQPKLLVLNGTGPLERFAGQNLPRIDLGRQHLRSALPGVIGALRRERPDVIVSTFGYVNLALLAVRRLLPSGARLVLRDANMPSLYLANVKHGRVMRWGYRLLYRRADRVVCTSRRMADEFSDSFGVARNKLAVVPNPVDVATLRKVAAVPKRVPGAGPRFVASGSKLEQKGLDRLLDMFALLSGDAHLVIVGADAGKRTLAAQASQLGIGDRVTLTKFDPGPWAHYAGADAFLLPSRWEGMPNAALEALACGTPVIATPEAGGIAEVAQDAPKAAVTISEAGEPFLAAMRNVVAGQRKRPARSLLPDAYAIDRAVASFEDVLSGEPVPCAV